MTIADFAEFYVNVLEPVLKFLIFFIIAVFLLYMLNVMRDTKKKGDLVTVMVNFITKSITKSVVLAGKVLLWCSNMLLKSITVIYTSIRDFLFSKI